MVGVETPARSTKIQTFCAYLPTARGNYVRLVIYPDPDIFELMSPETKDTEIKFPFNQFVSRMVNKSSARYTVLEDPKEVSLNISRYR